MTETSTHTHPPRSSLTGAGARGVIVSVVLMGIALWPLVRRPLVDSFPHSTYPMFSQNLQPVSDVDLAIGIDTVGNLVTLNPDLIADTGEVIVAGSIVRQAVRSGDSATANLCESVARNVLDDRSEEGPAIETVTSIEIRTHTYDAVKWFAGDTTPLDVIVHTSCPVEPLRRP
jgi:hypothetical protein